MNLFALRKHLDRLIHPVVSGLSRLPIHANAWTMLGALIGLVGGVDFHGHGNRTGTRRSGVSKSGE